MEVAIIGALISALGFGFANIVIKKALSNTSISQTLLSSMLSGVFFLALLVLLQGTGGEVTTNLLLTLAGFAIGEVCLYLSLYKAFEEADVTVASGVISVYPIISTIFTVIFLNESIGYGKIFSIFLLVIGAILISIDWENFRTQRLSTNSFMKGLPWALLCLLIHAIYFPALGNLTSTGMWEVKLLGIKIFASMILIVLFVFIKRSEFVLTKEKVFAGTLLGLLEVIGWVGLSYASSNSTGIIAIIVALGSSAPLVTAIIARIYLKEKLNILQYLGILTVVIGLTLIALI